LIVWSFVMQDQPNMQEQAEELGHAQENRAAQENGQNGNGQGTANSALEDRIAAAEAKAKEMQDAFLRAKAETENIRRRAQDDVAKAHKFAIENFAEALVPVKDSLEMALKLDKPSVDSLKEGVEMTLKQLSGAFERHRLLEINPVPGEKLDPMKHQAISMVPAEQEANTIVSVLQKGYMIADRLLRPALVTVAQ